MAEPARKLDAAAPGSAGNGGVKDIQQLIKEDRDKNSGRTGVTANVVTKATVRVGSPGRGVVGSIGPSGRVSSPQNLDAAAPSALPEQPEEELNPDREPEEEQAEQPGVQPEQAPEQQPQDQQAPEDLNKKVEPEQPEKEKKQKGENPEGDKRPYYQGPPPNQLNPEDQKLAQALTSENGQPGSREQNLNETPGSEQTPGESAGGIAGEGLNSELPISADDIQQLADAPDAETLKRLAAAKAGKIFVNANMVDLVTLPVIIPALISLILLNCYMVGSAFAEYLPKPDFWTQMRPWQKIIVIFMDLLIIILMTLIIWAALNYVCTGFSGAVLKAANWILTKFGNYSLSTCSDLDKAGLLIHF